MVYWNTHSLLWEVTMCVILYLTVLLLEAMPIIANLEWLRKRFPRITKLMAGVHHYAPILAIIGLGLSSLHQSSLGATYGVIKARPFWFKPEMSVLFMFSAIVGGISMTLFATMLSSRLTTKAKINDALIERVAQFVGYLLIGYFYFRAWDALATSYTYDPGRTEGLRFLTKGPLAFNFWVVEMLFGMIVPMILLLYKPTRMNRFWRMVALFLSRPAWSLSAGIRTLPGSWCSCRTSLGRRWRTPATARHWSRSCQARPSSPTDSPPSRSV
jgi:Ni/Fe-hydrogenase subunit HybB-like protein